MSMEKVKNLVLHNKEIVMFLVGFGVMHIGWYNLQRNDTLNKALAAGRDKDLIKEYKRLEREINTNWADQQQKPSEPQTTGVILTAANSLTNK